LPAFAQEADPVRIAYLFSDGNTPGTLAAFRKLVEEHPDLADRVELQILTESSYAETAPEALRQSDVLVLDIMNQQMLDRFDDEHSLDLLAEIGERGAVLGVGEGIQGEEHYRSLG